MRVYQRADKVCEQCGVVFTVPHYRRQKARFCSAKCKGAFIAAKHLNKGPKPWAAAILAKHRHKSTSRFPKGHTPWNAGVKGIHLSPETEFQKGQPSHKRAEIGAVRIRKCKGDQLRAFVKVSDPSGWRERAKVVWEQHNGPIPKGYVIHHKDRDTLNDGIDNLQALTRAEHIEDHRGDWRNE
jgi:hypothetical protein